MAPAGAVPYAVPQPPGAEPNIPPGVAAVERDRLRLLHEKEVSQYFTGTQLSGILKDKVVAFFATVVEPLQDVDTDFDNVSVLDLITYLEANFGSLLEGSKCASCE